MKKKRTKIVITKNRHRSDYHADLFEISIKIPYSKVNTRITIKTRRRLTRKKRATIVTDITNVFLLFSNKTKGTYRLQTK